MKAGTADAWPFLFGECEKPAAFETKAIPIACAIHPQSSHRVREPRPLHVLAAKASPISSHVCPAY